MKKTLSIVIAAVMLFVMGITSSAAVELPNVLPDNGMNFFDSILNFFDAVLGIIGTIAQFLFK